MGVAQWTEKPIEMQILCGKQDLRHARRDIGNRAPASHEPQKESELFIVASMWKKLTRPVNIHRSLMVRIAGFHPADPGSIPGMEAKRI